MVKCMVAIYLTAAYTSAPTLPDSGLAVNDSAHEYILDCKKLKLKPCDSGGLSFLEAQRLFNAGSKLQLEGTKHER